ncbi:signal peptidase I [Sulfurovum riftiae]|uniref:Signal peptidase I n=1 Tax=Sulfurovum riftiae TaxID=1630136 RepID=A0A151CET3_9BACT|nr:signal peptidase I [Sulfurovum riftiae]KYJ86007.1 S26 family signal peptidase [Sulfurovum riftiae]
MKKIAHGIYKFSSSWTGTVIIVLFLIFFVAQSFVIPSGSMKRSLLIGDFLFAKKFAYGIPTPHLPWLEMPLLPDFNGNGHLIEGPKPQREDIVIFRYPKNEKIHYVKRCVAVGGDEILFANNKLLIHFHEGDTYITKNYPKEKIRELRGKLWVENPYKDKYPGIQYEPESGDIFENLLNHYIFERSIDMIPVYVKNLDTPIYGPTTKEGYYTKLNTPPSTIDFRLFNALYKKVEEDHFYMIGDNRDNSNDSRFWGSVPYKLIVGKPWLIYMSLEHRSYDQILNGNGGGKDHAGLKRVCGNIPIDSKECKVLWEKQRYTVRWGRVGRRIDSIQLEQPIQ